MIKPIVLSKLDLRDEHMRRSIAFILDDQSIASWCLGLTLLDRDLIAEVLIQDTAGLSLLLRRDSKIKSGGQGVVHWKKPVPTLTLTTKTLHGWLDFSLKYYRDGIGDVTHIDSELQSNPPQDGITDVTVIVPYDRPGLTFEELETLVEELDKLDYDDKSPPGQPKRA